MFGINDGLNGACGRSSINIHSHDFVRNVDGRCLTDQPPLSSTIRSCVMRKLPILPSAEKLER